MAKQKPKQKMMQAVAIDQFGVIETLNLQEIPLPKVGAREVLIRLKWAGVGEWDPFEREGGYAEITGITPAFPYVLGSEGAGEVVAVGKSVKRFKKGDSVYAVGFLNPKGGFYAEYAVVSAGFASFIPSKLTPMQAGVMAGVGLTALRGLDDTLAVKPGESVLIFGASGGIGHLAVQIAKQMGARVFAVASGEDGVALVKKLGADAVVDGHAADVLEAAREFAPNGLDAALVTAGGEVVDKALLAMRDGGHVAYPGGVEPKPQVRPTVRLSAYNGEPDPKIIVRLNRIIESAPFQVHVDRIFPLEQVAEAHRALDKHYLGKLAIQIS